VDKENAMAEKKKGGPRKGEISLPGDFPTKTCGENERIRRDLYKEKRRGRIKATDQAAGLQNFQGFCALRFKFPPPLGRES